MTRLQVDDRRAAAVHAAGDLCDSKIEVQLVLWARDKPLSCS